MEENKKGSSGLFKWLFILLLAAAIVLFSFDNLENVPLGLVVTTTHLPMTVVILGSFLIGLILASSILSISSLRHKRALKAKDKEIASLEDRLRDVHTKIDALSDKAE